MESPPKSKRQRMNLPRLLSDDGVATMHKNGENGKRRHLTTFCGGERVSLRHSFPAMFSEKWCSLQLFDGVVDLKCSEAAAARNINIYVICGVTPRSIQMRLMFVNFAKSGLD